MILYFLRHCSAGESMSDPKKDKKRPLDETGVKQSHSVGRALAALEVQPELVISSPLTRAMQTASLVANELGFENKIQVETALTPQASYSDFVDMLRRVSSAESVIVVGHNPNLSDFLGKTIGGRSRPADIDLKKGGVARVEMRRSGGRLTWYLTPKIVSTLQGLATVSSRPKTSRK
jgi:phosphohistidine phosphatase